MGLDLIIMPLRDREELKVSTIYCDECLRFDRDYRIFGQIADLQGKSAVPDEGIEAVVCTYPLPPDTFLKLYTEAGIKKTRKNVYGEEMVYTFAEQMQKLKLPKNTSPANKAIMAYIRALESDTPLILEWR